MLQNTLLTPARRWLAGIVLGLLATAAGPAIAQTTSDASPHAGQSFTNQQCLACHDGSEGDYEVETADGDTRTLFVIPPEAFAKGVHANLQCISCHEGIVDLESPHQDTGVSKRADCASCHEDLWAKAEADGSSAQKPRLGIVVDNIKAHAESFHARPNPDDPSRPLASCNDCHNTHTFNIPPKGSEEHQQWRVTTPLLCGSCHDFALEEYAESIHGQTVLEKGDPKAAVCVDCHTSHSVAGTSGSVARLAITDQCGTCHEDNFRTYRSTYHGQIGALGHAYSAKCFDCHGSHDILSPDDPDSMMHVDNRLETCQNCHSDDREGMRTATAGYISFGPHAHGGDFEKYPEMWIATKFMVGLLIFVFAFFWAHSGLWYYREWQDRKAGVARVRIRTGDLKLDEKKMHFQRFHWGWRIGHLLFALATMTLVLTGTSALFAESAWAPIVSDAFGGPRALGLVHRVAAAIFIAIFVIHFIYVMQKLLRDRKFRWFGPDSMLPNWKDFADCAGMFKWFLGKGPRPQFERWAYYEKFDYWAVFWGVNVIGWSGLMLAFPHVTAHYLPGWVFNVATLVHGEEAFLAAVFLFTVHFFNNHFRPDKLPPPDIVMFTGTQTLEEFRHDHPAHYQRMVDTGELQKYLVEAPSAPMTLASKILGLVLIGAGLILLALVLNGFTYII
ncbi:cytochrome C [Rhodocyclaceae bacterium SMB388]